ncbi:MAG: succinate dehydrogenase, cytochrome b556 subunit [Thiobacillus sp.]|nr:succinate dehydrogenase, cytochrome b556 subunit [Thiobacillus sp.]MDP1923524.1 succinate dehydrogenase, cytochrome b556 subunit [Thiobacillus sp.]MDP3126707.1 succinate dehydrogenase, cytochrome b556 subunit [Thiobacillus sp.]
MSPLPRPVYLDLFRIRLPLAGWVSILHRLSGAVLFLGFPFAIWLLSISLAHESGFAAVRAWLALPLAKLTLLGLVWLFALHYFAGLRHLALDVHWGTSLKAARRSSVAVLVLSGAATLVAAWGVFA